MMTMLKNSVLLTISFNAWGTSRKADIKLVDAKKTDPALLALTKKLIVSPELEAVWKLDHATRQQIKKLCPPGSPFKSSFYLLPLCNALKAEEILDASQADRAALVQRFIAAYPAQREEAKAKLADQYRPEDYPADNEIGNYFSMQRNFVTLDVPDNLPPEIREKEKARAEKLWTEVSQELTDAMRVSFLKLVDHMQDSLKPGEGGKEKTIRKDCFNSIKAFMESFEVKNITNDLELAKLVQRAKGIIEGTTPEEMKASADTANAIASRFGEIKAVLSGMVTEKAKRAFDFNEE